MAADILDLKVGLKVLPLLSEKIPNPAIFNIIYDPANAASKAEADAIKSMIDAGITAPGGIKLTSMLVGVGELDKLSKSKLAFLSSNLSEKDVDAVSKTAAALGILTMSTHLSYVKANKCVIGIISKPSVQIYYSPMAADAGKIGFAQAFVMLVSHL